MKIKTAILVAIFLVCWAAAGVAQSEPATGAQQTTGATATQEASDRQDDSSQPQPAGRVRDYVVPTLRFIQTIDNNAQFRSAETGFESVTSLSGDLALHHLWRHATLDAVYQVGGSIYAEGSQPNATFHNFGLQQIFEGRRSRLSLNNHFSYLPSSSSGFAGLGLDPTSGMNALGVDVTQVPTQSVLTHAPRYDNSIGGDWQYRVGRASRISFDGSYSLLRSKQSGFLESDTYHASASYSHDFGVRNSLGLRYGASMMRYTDSTDSVDSHAIQIEFSHRLNRHVSIDLAGGPQYTTSNGILGTHRALTEAVSAGVTSHWSALDVRLSYNNSVSAGSGVLEGARTQSVQFTASRQLTREWHGVANFGYAHNSPLSGAIGPTFDTVTGGVSVERRLGRTMGMFVQYSVQQQDSSTVLPGALAGNTLRHVIGFGLNWNLRPMPVR